MKRALRNEQSLTSKSTVTETIRRIVMDDLYSKYTDKELKSRLGRDLIKSEIERCNSGYMNWMKENHLEELSGWALGLDDDSLEDN